MEKENSDHKSLPYARQSDTGFREAEAAMVAYGVRVGIRTNKPELLSKLLGIAPYIWKPSSAAMVDRLYSLQVNTEETGSKGHSHYHLLEDSNRVAGSDDLNRVLETFERLLKMYLAETAHGMVFVHAGAVGWKGKAIIIPGRSFSGKTSLVAELVRAGATYYSDEYAVLDKDGRVYPYSTPLSIREPGSYKQKKYGVEEFGGESGLTPLSVGMVIVTHYKEGERWRPRKLSAGKAMLELLANTIPARLKPEAVITALQKVASGALALKAARGEADETAKLILRRQETCHHFDS